ncbi:MAG: serine/threonine-protein kinase [Planctomycetota bacterium]|nr:serine/threonine-protein kinase [Planctomycetota bacterium]
MFSSSGDEMPPPNHDETVEYKPEIDPKSSSDRFGDSSVPEFPGYAIEGELGRGGLGVVYRGRDLTLNRPVAIKVLTSTEASHDQRQKVIEEARRAAALGDRCIVTIFGVIEHQGSAAIVMELVDGHELQNVSSVLEPKQVAKIVSEAARAISVAHHAGILHRDLKPQNVVVTPGHEVRILDFGLSIEMNSENIEEGFSGTVAYAAPERLQGQMATPASDIFSLGVLFHEALTGRHPFAKLGKPPTMSSILAGEPSIPRALRPAIPEDLERICLSCLAFKPEHRPNADEVHQALVNFLAGQPIQMRSSVVTDHLLNRVEEHVGTIEKWKDLGLVDQRERDQLRWRYRRVLEGDDLWPTETRKLRVGELGIYICIWTSLVSSFFTALLYRQDVGVSFSWLLPMGTSVALGVAGLLSQQFARKRVTPLFFGGAIISLVPTLIALLTAMVWAPAPDDQAELFGEAGIANRTLFFSSLVSLIAAVLRLNRTGVSFYSWVAATLYGSTHFSLLLVAGYLTWEAGAQALGILSITIAWMVGTGFEKMQKPRFARPFHWLGGLTLLIGLYKLSQVPLLSWIGIDAMEPQAATGWSLAISGLMLLLITYFLENSIRLERRRIANYLEWVCPVFILGGLYQAALSSNPIAGWQTSSSIWVAIGPFIAAVAMFITLTARSWRPRFMISAMAGIALSVRLVQHHNLIPIEVMLLLVSLGGLLLAAVFYIRMELATHTRKQEKQQPPPIDQD